MSKIRNSRLLSKRFSLVEQWLECDLTKKDFCEQNQINVHTFSYWLNKYNKRTGTGSVFCGVLYIMDKHYVQTKMGFQPNTI